MGEASVLDLVHQLKGHFGNLTPDQDRAFATFKENLTNAKLYTPPTDDQKASHDDVTLLRFLRARSFEPAGAQTQFASAESWRKKHNVSKVYHEAKTEDMESSKRFYPTWTGRRDKIGLPLHVYRLASLESIQNELDAIPNEERYRRIFVLHEYMTLFTFPLCSYLPHATAPIPISSTTNIIDLDSVSLSSMWKLRHHLQEASRLSTANYPETLHHIAIVNSPSFFPTIWSWIKGWFDEGTRQKIHVLGKDPGASLRELIDPSNLPATYGGELPWKFGDAPILDEDAKKVLGEMPTGPVIFVDGTVMKAPAP